MKEPPARHPQRGYLMEVPILLFIVGTIVVMVLPMLTPLGRKILLCIAAFPVLFGLFYMIVIPGWMPSDKGRIKPPWSLIVFLILAVLILTGIGLFILNGS
jgi:hypothetical protein